MNKRDLSEADIKAKFITPAVLKAGWDEHTQLGREIFFTDGRIYVKGKLMQNSTSLEKEISISETNARMLMQAVLKEAFEVKEEQIFEKAG